MPNPTTPSRGKIRKDALAIIRNANQAVRDATMALAWLDVETKGFDDLSAEHIQSAIDSLKYVIKNH